MDGKYDSSNALVLPSKKRKTKIKESKKQDTKILSRKHRKLLEKVVEKKQKKEKVDFITSSILFVIQKFLLFLYFWYTYCPL